MHTPLSLHSIKTLYSHQLVGRVLITLIVKKKKNKMVLSALSVRSSRFRRHTSSTNSVLTQEFLSIIAIVAHAQSGNFSQLCGAHSHLNRPDWYTAKISAFNWKQHSNMFVILGRNGASLNIDLHSLDGGPFHRSSNILAFYKSCKCNLLIFYSFVFRAF